MKRLVPVLSLVVLGACSVAGTPPPVPEGHEVFELCQQCHGENAGGNRLANAPSIAGLPQWYIEAQLKKFKEGGRGTHFDDLTGMQMRPMALSLRSDEEIKVIAKYVADMPAVKPEPTLKGGDAANGGKIFEASCKSCHMPDGSGNEAMKAPPLNHATDWYLLSALKKYKEGIRGANPKDPTGPMMRPMAQSLKNEQEQLDVVAYLSTLQKK
jgi:cytochrome c553